jgi:hypothetical protein
MDMEHFPRFMPGKTDTDERRRKSELKVILQLFRNASITIAWDRSRSGGV